eukprot:Skav227743  [mRNA]  locus=scaffold3513:226627:227130:+ [translate_table: standard]
MQFGLEGLLEIYLADGFGALEHPAEPVKAEAACIWRTSATLYLLSLPGIVRVRVLQGQLGAFSPKPTDVMTVNLPDLARQFQRWTLTSDLGGASIGVSSSGEFLTSRLKEYPPAMSGAIADSMASALHRFQVGETEHIPLEFLTTCKGMDVNLNTEAGTCMGKDFSG